jgi:hypothetical protein
VALTVFVTLVVVVL